MTTRQHPAWCACTEPDDQGEHVSVTLHAAAPDDILDIRLRRSRPDDLPELDLIEIEFMEDEIVTTYLLQHDQARMLIDRVGQLLPA